jgi:hypothetical protein
MEGKPAMTRTLQARACCGGLQDLLIDTVLQKQERILLNRGEGMIRNCQFKKPATCTLFEWDRRDFDAVRNQWLITACKNAAVFDQTLDKSLTVTKVMQAVTTQQPVACLYLK